MTFDEFVLDWFHTMVDEATEERVTKIVSILGCRRESADENREFLMELNNGREIWDNLFAPNSVGAEAHVISEDERATMIAAALDQAVIELRHDYDWAEDLIDDMVYYCADYNCPISFFEDLAEGGCQSGMIGMFVYNSDCKAFYVEHIDDMEGFKEDFEDELGMPITNKEGLPHYTFMCWLCYEELAHRIAQELWPDKF